MRGDALLGDHSAANGCHGANDRGANGADSDGDYTPDGNVFGATPTGATTASVKKNSKKTVFDPWRAGSWEDLAAPAARLWAACRPSCPAQLEALDEVLGDMFGKGGKVGALS